MKAEVAAAEARGKAEAEKAGLQTALDAALSRAEAEQSSLQSSIHRLETETKDYKVSCVVHAAQLRMLLSSSSCRQAPVVVKLQLLSSSICLHQEPALHAGYSHLAFDGSQYALQTK